MPQGYHKYKHQAVVMFQVYTVQKKKIGASFLDECFSELKFIDGPDSTLQYCHICNTDCNTQVLFTRVFKYFVSIATRISQFIYTDIKQLWQFKYTDRKNNKNKCVILGLLLFHKIKNWDGPLSTLQYWHICNTCTNTCDPFQGLIFQ